MMNRKSSCAADQRRHRFAALEHEARRRGRRQSRLDCRPCVGHHDPPQNGLAPISFCVSSTATAWPLLNAMVSAALTRRDHVLRPLDAQADDAHGLEHRLRRLAHGKLPRISLAEIAAHAHQRQERKAAALDQRQHVDAIADPARLHQQHAARAAEIGAGDQRDAFLLGGRARSNARSGSASERSIRIECPASGT